MWAGLPGKRFEQLSMSIHSAVGPEVERVAVKASEVAFLVDRGVLDFGVTGSEWLLEYGTKGCHLDALPIEASPVVKLAILASSPRSSPLDELQNCSHLFTPFVGLGRELAFRSGASRPEGVCRVLGGLEDMASVQGSTVLDVVESGDTAASRDLSIAPVSGWLFPVIVVRRDSPHSIRIRDGVDHELLGREPSVFRGLQEADRWTEWESWRSE